MSSARVSASHGTRQADGKWLVKGGFGFFHNWPTLANLQEQYRGNPPGNIFPTFQSNSSSPAPIFGLGTSNNKPFGFPYPVLPARPLNPQGGITGLQFNIGGIDPNLVSPVTYTYSAAVDHELGQESGRFADLHRRHWSQSSLRRRAGL